MNLGLKQENVEPVAERVVDTHAGRRLVVERRLNRFQHVVGQLQRDPQILGSK